MLTTYEQDKARLKIVYGSVKEVSKAYNIQCVKEAYRNKEMSEWEYKYALNLLTNK